MELRKLPVVLSDEEVLQRGEELARAIDELETYQADERERVKDAADHVKLERKRIGDLATVVRAHKEEREVQCEWEIDYEAGLKRLKRLDTHAVVESKVLEPDERQTKLMLLSKQGPKDAKAAAVEQKTLHKCPECGFEDRKLASMVNNCPKDGRIMQEVKASDSTA